LQAWSTASLFSRATVRLPFITPRKQARTQPPRAGTFTGIEKPLHFAAHRERFAQFDDKIVYEALLGPPAAPGGGEDPWGWEAHQRDSMTALLESRLQSTTRPPLVIFSDVDEIPSAHTLRLLKACDFASDGKGPLHLQMRTFLYSFEWPIGWGSWRAQVHEWGRGGGTYYRHSMASDRALADAGWHCSYCFRRLADFSGKMQGACALSRVLTVRLRESAGFSHADRLNGDSSLLLPQRIQQVICDGKDIFNMLPEAYSVRTMPNADLRFLIVAVHAVQGHDPAHES
jgi:beta-1,4-mannosyl-glycoprotein beta-1,4-N-acetylglucosaminyltransferase